jgi:cell division protein FtsB
MAFAVVAYFAGYAVFGSRGALALEDTGAALGVQQEKLSLLKAHARVLQHRIELMDPAHPDDDLVEELARGVLLDGAPHQVAMRRDRDQP